MDDVLRGLVLARIIEPTSKIDAKRVLTETGIAAASYRTVKRRLRGCQGFRSFRSAWRTLPGVETVNMIRKGQIRWLQKGDILVASMTRPEMVPAMKLASAIVTDEGGVTSHAAIVSRELGIPCVTCTVDGTHRVHTGDLIRLDGNAGQIEIIERGAST